MLVITIIVIVIVIILIFLKIMAKKQYQTNIEDLLEKIRVNTAETEINTDNLALDVSVDGLETLQGATNTLLTSILAAQNASLDGDEQQVDVISGAIVATLSATDNAVLDAIETTNNACQVLLGTIDEDTDAIRTDMAAIETLITATNAAIATFDAVLDSSLTKQTEIDTALDTIDGVLDSSLTKLGEIETTNNANQVLLGTIDSDTDAIKTAVEKIDNAVHVDDAAFTLGTHSGTMMMGFAGTQSVNANDAGAIAMDTDGAIHVSDGGNALTVDGTVTANLSATDNAVLDAMVVDLAAIEVATEAIEVLNTSILAKNTENNVALDKIVANQLLMLGNSGSVTISGNAATTGSAGTYCAVYFIKDTTPTTLTIGSSTTVTGQLYAAGTWLYGDVTAITGDSGGMYVLYKGNPA